ncbi:MAG: MoaD/ThiS family protein [Gammaproteobacteria bacterium]|nr:MAG: MoaD/ThiS family protein [Gammaproteobacteria bacterium]
MCPSSSASTVRLLYFAALAETLGRTAEEVELPSEVSDVRGLLAWLRGRGGPWQALEPGTVQITVNRQFAEADTPIGGGDEIALVPRRAP